MSYVVYDDRGCELFVSKTKSPLFFIKEDAEEIAVYQGLALPTSDNNQTIHALV